MDQPTVEAWRSIPGYERTYEVSSLGRVKNLPRNTTRGGMRKTHVGKRGYPVLSLVQDGEQRTHEVHRLVALAFLGQPPPGHEVRHLDGDPLNPSLSNLAYGTRSENNLDAVRHGTSVNTRKTHCPQGHPYVGDNILTAPSRPGTRYCRTCNVANRAKRRKDFDEGWAS